MNTSKKIMLLFLLFLGHTELNCSQKSMSLNDYMQKKSIKNDFINNELIYTVYTPVSQKIMNEAILSRKNNVNKNRYNFEYQANELIKQNYKTDQMKYDILLLMNSDLSTEIDSDSASFEKIIPTEFMKVNIPTASIENLPTIFQILTKTDDVNQNNNDNKQIATRGLKATLRAINGAIADAVYDKKSIFAENDIELKLRNMQKTIEARLIEINPTYWLQISLGIGSLVAVAAVAGVYYSGITMKDTQEYIANIIKKYKPAINTTSSLPKK